ncbi:helix-turn-helix transcriptional regulator [Actinokineospora enzanensis]|uniref:helix-turn-helix transcriptional regulator n=1 Tax=Actinokineospora enzanensis TaxID=155975 RepID=UPI00035C1142|nr:helix-turn-helix transcriptional regulator [Actinokineospora enzanensis]
MAVDDLDDDRRWWTYFKGELDRREWTTADFERASGINRSRVVAWSNGSKISIDNARAVASTFNTSLLTVLVNAGLLTADEAGAPAAQAPNPADLTDDQLLGEIRRRLHDAPIRRHLTPEEIEADPDIVTATPPTPPGRRRLRSTGDSA